MLCKCGGPNLLIKLGGVKVVVMIMVMVMVMVMVMLLQNNVMATIP